VPSISNLRATGSFVGFIAGFLNYFRAVSFFNILDDRPIIRLIFQKDESRIQNFNIGSFHTDLMQMIDSCIYGVRNENFNMLMFVYGIDTDSRCNYRSKVNLVHFIWVHFERLSIRKFEIALLPKDSASPHHLFDTLLEDTRLFYLRYYRAESDDWWKDRKNCDECIVRNRLTLTVLSSCRQLETAHVLYANSSYPPHVT